MLEIRPRDGGASFDVRVLPRASRNEIAGVQEGMLRVRLTAPPVEGAANQALLKILSKALGVAQRDLEILAGETSRQKTIAVTGLAPQAVLARLNPYLES